VLRAASAMLASFHGVHALENEDGPG
jgi:hypothetical protein